MLFKQAFRLVLTTSELAPVLNRLLTNKEYIWTDLDTETDLDLLKSINMWVSDHESTNPVCIDGTRKGELKNHMPLVVVSCGNSYESVLTFLASSSYTILKVCIRSLRFKR